jgi:hypothetical protein
MQAPILRQLGLKVKAVTQLTSLYRIVYLTSSLIKTYIDKNLLSRQNDRHHPSTAGEFLLD